jgi:molybdopterin-guanine dinucleotide biosynthesis protein A
MGGGDKPLRLLAGRSILDHVVTRLRPQVSALALNINDDPARFASYDLPTIADSIEGRVGPLAGILAAMEWAAEVPHVVTVPADAPFLPADLVIRLQAARTEADAEIAVASSGGRRHPVAALWSTRLAGALRQALTIGGLRKAETFVERFRVAAADYPVTPIDPFHNINTPEDLALAEAMAARLG